MEFASLEENKMQLNLRQQLQNKTWSIAEYQLQEGCRVVRTAVSPPANRAMLHWAAAVAEKQNLGLQSCIIYKRDHVRLLQQQHLHQQTGSCYTLRQQQLQRNKTLIAELTATTRERERGRERERERCKWVAEQHFHQMCMLHTQIGQCKKWLQHSALPMLLGWTWWHMPMHLLATGSAKWSDRFSSGPLPVTMACMKKPKAEDGPKNLSLCGRYLQQGTITTFCRTWSQSFFHTQTNMST